MPHTDNAAFKFELLQSDDFSQYLIRTPTEILHVLRNLIRKRAMVTAYPDNSREHVLTTVLEADDARQRIVLDMAASEADNRRAEAADELICITQIDNVKIQFPLGALRRIEFEGHEAFEAPMPDRLLRLQRREYFRLTAPVSHSLNCQLPMEGEDGGTITFEARVLDISGGGIAFVVPPEGVEFKPEMEFHDCQITLPEIGTVQTGLRIRNVFRVTNRNGISMLRAGCEFVEMPERVASVIHRYILKVERELGSREKRR